MRAYFTLFCLIAGVCAASNYRQVAEAVNDDQLLVAAGVEPREAVIRKQCGAAVQETDDRPEYFDCVYVQTEKDLNLFSLEDGSLMAELQTKLSTIDGVALQRTGRWAQVQVFNGDEVAAFYIFGDRWIDVEQTEAVFRWLLDHGVRQQQPRKWIGP